MKPLNKYLSAALIVLAFIFLTFFINANYQINEHYKLAKLIEKDITTEHTESSLNVFPTKVNPADNSYLIIDNKFYPGPDVPAPLLIGVDKFKNFYIENALEDIKVFDYDGNYKYYFKFPEGYHSIH